MRDVRSTLKDALRQLEAERARLDKQIDALRAGLFEPSSGHSGVFAGGRARRAMSVAERRAIRRRAKAPKRRGTKKP